MARKLKPKVSTTPKSPITTTKVEIENKKLIISYEHLCLNDKKYSMNEIGDNKQIITFYSELVSKLNEYSKFNNFKKQITSNRTYSKSNHIHPIDWNDNRIHENSFNCLDDNLMQQVKNECWQLGINNQGFRIHGFFIENIFYIVWLDPLHNLYERK